MGKILSPRDYVQTQGLLTSEQHHLMKTSMQHINNH